MQVVYARQPLPTEFSKSIFLAGPTPRSNEVPSWRPQAISILEELGYDGVVFVPEINNGEWPREYEEQILWEEAALHLSDCIVFWVPRDMTTLPALTTNVEFGRWYESGKVVFGAPGYAQNVRYLEYYAKKFAVPVMHTLTDILIAAMAMIGSKGEIRHGGECQVPLYIWRTEAFQQWYDNLTAAGNRLDGARVLWTFRVGEARQIIFFWALHVDIYIASEDRHKTNEVVIARPDISTVVAYRRGKDLFDTDVVLIKEFRSPVSNPRGFVYEVPGGSSFKPGKNPQQLAADECNEETGLNLDASRLRQHESRQLGATLSTHHAHLYSVELSVEEIEALLEIAGVPHGAEDESERTYVEVWKLRDILESTSVDWSVTGMILSVLTQLEDHTATQK
jgi:8-oxo-dGTP pyrophosphatase MutT (NUDIX family)